MIYIFHLTYIILISSFLFFVNISQINCIISYSNPSSISLSNGNKFIIHNSGIDIFDGNLNKIKTSLTFSNTEQITTENLSKVSISKFSDGNIICLINDYAYIFDSEGNFIYNHQINRNRHPDYYTIVGKDSYNYYMAFIYNDLVHLYYYEYNKNNNRTNLILSDEYYSDGTLKNSGISCYVMNHLKEGEVFTCFYLNTQSGKDNFKIRFYARDGGTFKSNRKFSDKSFECPHVNYFNSDINSEHSKVLICFSLSSGENYCISYNINSDIFSSEYHCNGNICRNIYYGLKVNYFSENDEFVFSCSGNNGNVTLCIFDKDFNYNQKVIKFEECNNIEGYSNIYYNNDYYIISDENCSGPANNNNPDIPSTFIEEEEKVEEKEKKEDKIEFICELEKCEKCDIRSQLNNLCISCNNKKGYYPLIFSSFSENEISGVNDNNYIDCFNDKTKPSKFYFNKISQHFEQCFETCSSCEYGGNQQNNNCTTCNISFFF